MRYSASEKLEIIHTVEDASLGIKRTLIQLGIPRSTFYGWYDRYLAGGLEALDDIKPVPGAVWNKVPEEQRKAAQSMCPVKAVSLVETKTRKIRLLQVV